MIHVEDHKVKISGNNEDIQEELTNLLLAFCKDTETMQIVSDAMHKVNELLAGTMKGE